MNQSLFFGGAAVLLALLGGCGPEGTASSSGSLPSLGGSTAGATKAGSTPSTQQSASPTLSATGTQATASAKAAVRFDGFATPESAVYDASNDRYLVSNVNGKPVEADNNGFISTLAPDGKVAALKWIEGGKGKTSLNAPKGLTIAQSILYVADIDHVRMFDLKTGGSLGEVKIEGATFLNDIVAAADGSVYVSDSGLKMEGSDFAPSGTDAVYKIVAGKSEPVAKTADLGRPNGLALVQDTLLVVTFGSGALYELDKNGQKQGEQKLPKGGLDGLLLVEDAILVTSWDGECVYRAERNLDGKGFAFVPLLEGLSAPADIGYDSKRKRLIVPRFTSNAVETYDLP
jgi:sugar lactone lactonase YvrE